MKKVLLALVIVGSIVLSACGAAPPADTTAEPQDAVSQSEDVAVEIAFQEVQKYKDSLDSVSADYLAEIRNTGNVPVKIRDLAIELNDASGNLVDVTEYISAFPDVISPGESAYVMEGIYNDLFDTPLTLDEIGEATLRFTLDKADEPLALAVELSETKLQFDSYGTPQMIGRAKNTSDTALKYVYVVGVVRDASGVLQNIIFTVIDELPPGQDSAFSQSAIFGYPDADYSASTIEFMVFDGSY